MDIKTALVGSLSSSSVGADGSSSSSKTSASEQFLKVLREQVTPVQGESVPTEVSRTLIRGLDPKESAPYIPPQDEATEPGDEAARATDPQDTDDAEAETVEAAPRRDDPPSTTTPSPSPATTSTPAPSPLAAPSLPLTATVPPLGEGSSTLLGTPSLSGLVASPTPGPTTGTAPTSQPQPASSETAAADAAQGQALPLAPLAPATSVPQALTSASATESAPLAPTKTPASPTPPKAEVSQTARDQAAQLARTVDGETTVEVKIQNAQSAQTTDPRPSASTTTSALPLETARALETNGNAGFQGGQTPGGQTGQGQGGQGGQTASSSGSALVSNSSPASPPSSALPDSSFATQWLSQAGALDGPDAGFLTPAQAQAAAVSAATSSTNSSLGNVVGTSLSGAGAAATTTAPLTQPGTTPSQTSSPALGTAIQAPSGQTVASGPQATAQTSAAARPPSPEAQRLMDQVKVNISKALDRGMDQVSVQLTPKTLGRIDVKMEIGSGGEVQVSVLADNQQTLDLLRSDQRGLERALQDAGLKADSGSIDFGLRGGSGQENLNQDGASSGLGQASRGTDASETETLLGDDPLRAAQAAARGGVDIRV